MAGSHLVPINMLDKLFWYIQRFWSTRRAIIALWIGRFIPVTAVKSLWSSVSPRELRDVNRHLSISFMAALLIGTGVAFPSDGSNTNLALLFPPTPAAASQIVRDVQSFMPTIQADPDIVAKAYAGTEAESYLEQVSNLAMADSNQFAGFAIQYTVQKGDTWSSIARDNNLHTASVFAANGIDEGRLKKGLPQLNPGMQITIPAEDIDGPSNWVSILNDINNAKKLAKNLPSKSLGKKTLSRNHGTSITDGTRNYTSYGGYPGGYCTAFVASQRAVGQWGNAGHWLSGARADGYATGSTPQVGAIGVSAESGWGHVFVVEGVSGSVITVKEQNYKGFGVISTRTVDYHNIPMKGFIY